MLTPEEVKHIIENRTSGAVQILFRDIYMRGGTFDSLDEDPIIDEEVEAEEETTTEESEVEENGSA